MARDLRVTIGQRQALPPSPIQRVLVDTAAATDTISGSIPGADDWQTAVASRSYTAVEGWYAANTGHEALGIGEQDLIPGSLESEFDGQVIEGIVGSHIRLRHSNVTIRGCRVEDGALYGVYCDPTFGATHTGNVIEYCTVAHPTAIPDETTAQSAFMVQTSTTQRALTVRNCNVHGWAKGVRLGGRCVAEYNWVHDFQHPPEVHLNSIRFTHSGGIGRRNYCTDGRSAIMSIYFDKEQTDNILYEENILNGSSPDATPSYIMTFKSGDFSATATDIRIINNYFGDQSQFGLISGDGGVPWGAAGNERTGNQMFLTGDPV